MKNKLLFLSSLILLISLSSCKSAVTSVTPKVTYNPDKKEQPKSSVTENSTSETNNKSISKNQEIEKPVRSVSSKIVRQKPVIENDNVKIYSRGIGDAKIGMTFGKLKKILGKRFEFKVEKNFMVDWDAIAVIKNGSTQYYILYPAGTTLTNQDKITNLLTYNPDYKTLKGIGVGSLLKEVEAIYGEAKLNYNTDNEGREYVRFAKQPSKNINFRLGSYGDGSLSGIYPPKSDSYHETKEYKEDAKIQAIEINGR
jgi:hypothetical protein